MKRAITRKQYENAKRIIAQYEQQVNTVTKKQFSLDDLEIVHYSVAVPCLTESVVDEGFAEKLTEKIEGQGVSVDFVSLDDMGYISIHFRNMGIRQGQIDAVLAALNSN